MTLAIVVPGGSSIVVVLKGFEVSVTYELPSSVSKAQATKAIAAANRVPESKVHVTIRGSGRRLAASRRLAALVDATIKLETADKAKIVQKSSADSAKLKAEFKKAGLEVEPSLKVAPKVAVQLETKVVSSAGTVVQPLTALQLANVGQAIGGKVKVVTNPTTATTTTPTAKNVTTTITVAPHDRDRDAGEIASCSVKFGAVAWLRFVLMLGLTLTWKQKHD